MYYVCEEDRKMKREIIIGGRGKGEARKGSHPFENLEVLRKNKDDGLMEWCHSTNPPST